MSHDSYVCGFIKISGSIDPALAAIAELPQTADEDSWPFLPRSMFSHTVSPQYRDAVVHFAASYKDILGSWEAWVYKLEQLLAKFDFDEATVLIENCYRGELIARWSGGPRRPFNRGLCAVHATDTDP